MTQIDQIIADALAGSPETHVAILAREVVRLREPPAVVVPELTEEDLVRAGGPYCINDREPFQRGARWAAAFIRENSRAIPADRAPGDGNQFGVGFVEACGMLAAKPFDRPTLAAGLIREGGMVSALAETSSDGPGISVLRVEMRTDLRALRANQGGANE